MNPPGANLAKSETRSFLEALFANKPDTAHILIWTLAGDFKRSQWFLDVSRAAAYVESLTGCNVYVGIGLSPSDFGEFNRCESEKTAGIVGLTADIDMKSDAHPKGARPATITQALSILPAELPPTIIIETGNGVQCWWLFKEPWMFEDAAARQQAASLSSRWQTLLKYCTQKNGWAFERLGDLARVLRIPGTSNIKDPTNPKNVTIRRITDQRYNPSDLRAYLANLEIPVEDEKASAVKTFTEYFTDDSLVINLAVGVHDEQLRVWMEQDPQFCRTWNHQRSEMQDESQSGYDLALACFGVKHGLSDQQITDLIVHNRRVHGAKQSKSLDYFRRTISTARNGTSRRIAATDATALPPIRPTLSAASAEDPNEKAKLCERISGMLGVQIVRLVKLNGQEPVFIMEFEEGGCIQFPDAGKLISQRVAAMIAVVGGKPVRLRRNGLKEQSRWALPVEEFDPKGYQNPHEDDCDGD